ncbi:penicillin-binding transpeptidase domain-containing protein [Amycolatopsis suaedae]|uniref:penicillin-binding transpeptidase domain-containing protein n=1 Tax=Amycolatopsis suaedae TaxID=2510978 RepID=UPI003B82E837
MVGRGWAVAAVVVFALSGCSVFASEPGPEEITRDFLDALAAGDTARAAGLTDTPDAARPVLDQARAALRPESIGVTLHRAHAPSKSTTATARYRLDWRLPHGRTWSYDGDAQLTSADGRWRVRWQPSVLHPRLAQQQEITLRTQQPDRAPVLDRDGETLLAPDRVVSVLLDPAKAGDVRKVAAALATALKQFEPGITEQSIVDGPKQPVVTLRQSDYQRIKPAIYDLPGVRFSEQERLLPADKSLGEQILPAIRSTVDERVEGAAGWRIVTVTPTGSEIAELHNQPAQPADAVTATLSKATQAAAEAALDGVEVPAAIVALQPSTGELLAVAQNAAADVQGPIALSGRYPPGSTFKIATAAAALTTGVTRADAVVDCPGTTTIEGRLIPNDGRFALGSVPLSTAFAHSCNTTFARLSTQLPPAALTDAARDLGIGADFVIPGLTTITGSVPQAGNTIQQAENGFGQGTVLASPFGMALAAATVASGRTPVPTLLRGTPTAASQVGRPLRPDVLAALRSMTRAVVTGGTAGVLAQLPEVHGKTGTAQFGDGSQSHGWFVGYAGDLAFAVLLVGGGTSAPAVQAAHRFLTAVGS